MNNSHPIKFNHIWILFFFSLLLVIDTKTFLLAFFFFGLFLYFYLKFSLNDTLFFLLLAALPFEKTIRDWLITVVPHGIELWQPGYNFTFGLNLKMILTSTLLLILLPLFLNTKLFIKTTLPSKIALIIIVIVLFGAVISPRFDLAIIGFFRFLMTFSVYFLSIFFLRKDSHKRIFHYYLLSLLLFFGFVGTLQLLLRHPLGINMEDIRPIGGFQTTDGETIYRVNGLTNHPTFFGAQLAMLLPLSLAYFISSIKKKNIVKNYIPLLSFLFGFIALIGTFSRSAWISIVIPFIFLLNHLSLNKIINYLRKSIVIKLSLGIFTILILLFIPSVLSRTQSLSNIWISDNGLGRIELMKHAYIMTINNPVFGVGINRFTEVMLEQGVKEEFRGFIYPVHNTFLLIFSEMGIPAGILFIIFIFIILIHSWQRIEHNLINIGIFLGVITFIINAQFQTLFNQDASFDFLMLFLGYLTVS
jgi:hypothetical protein